MTASEKATVYRYLMSSILPTATDKRKNAFILEHQFGADLFQSECFRDIVEQHRCSEGCKVRAEDVIAARVIPVVPSFARVSRTSMSIAMTTAQQRQKHRVEQQHVGEKIDTENIGWWEKHWPQVNSEQEWKEVHILILFERNVLMEHLLDCWRVSG
jgi:hypothetical protein